MHHGVRITDAALVAAATLSDRYITARFLPDKAIDLVDEAASRLRMEIDCRPGRDRRAASAPSPAARWRRWRSPRRPTRRPRSGWSGCARELADRREELAALTARWQREKAGLDRGRRVKEELDDAARRGRARPARRRLRSRGRELIVRPRSPRWRSSSPQRPRPRCPARARWSRRRSAPTTSPKWSPSWTGIPAGRLLEGETAKLLRMEDVLAPAADRAGRGRPRRVRRGAPRPRRASPTRTGRPARSCSSARPASARPSWPRRWPTSSSTTSARWCAST